MRILIFLMLLGTICAAQDSTAKIDERFLNSVVNIKKFQRNQPGFEAATGFILSVQVDTGRIRAFLVTNKHVICNNYTQFDAIQLSDSLVIHFYETADRYKDKAYQVKLKDEQGKMLHNVRIHPDSSIDIAVIDITRVFIDHSDISPYSLDTSFVAHFEHLKNINIGLGSQIFALGYPAGERFSNGNQAIGKFGYISSSVSGKVKYDAYFLDRSNNRRKLVLKDKFFIVDGLLIPGNSGSPIINPKETKTYRPSSGTAIVSQQYIRNFILGIQSSIIGNTGLSICYSSDYFMELIRDLL